MRRPFLATVDLIESILLLSFEERLIALRRHLSFKAWQTLMIACPRDSYPVIRDYSIDEIDDLCLILTALSSLLRYVENTIFCE